VALVDAPRGFGGPAITPVVIGAVLLGAFGWIVAGLAIGLFVGERGRRQAAERLAITGSPSAPLAARLADMPDAEQRVLAAGRMAADRRFSESTIQKGVEQLQQEAAALGRPLGPKEAREQVIAMLYGSLQTEPDLPELGL
jgi:hypothetical protein